jgi:hypothetical protein
MLKKAKVDIYLCRRGISCHPVEMEILKMNIHEIFNKMSQRIEFHVIIFIKSRSKK